MADYDTIVDTLNALKSRGYTIDFNLRQNELVYGNDGHLSLAPDEFEIDETYRFEGMNDPDDSSIVYAISSHHGLKGILVNAYGPDADEASAEMVSKLHYHIK